MRRLTNGFLVDTRLPRPRMIDLNRAERAVCSLPNNAPLGYQPRTLHAHNLARSAHLPLFPTISVGPNNHLLLANVPVSSLVPHEVTRRQRGAYTDDALTLMKQYEYSDDFALLQDDAEALATRLRVGLSIVTFNATQLRGDCCVFLSAYCVFRRNVLKKRPLLARESTLTSKPMALALEFYLQMDGSLSSARTRMSDRFVFVSSRSGRVLHEDMLVSRRATTLDRRRSLL
jgi:hypothetical protein